MTAQNDLTRNQHLVLDTLNKADGPMSAYTILDQLRDEGLRAPLQVYRALDKLLEMGLAHRLAQSSGTDELYYALPTTATSNQMFTRGTFCLTTASPRTTLCSA